MLRERGGTVRAVVRDPARAGLPDGVELVPGNLRDPAGLEQRLGSADAAFLVWPFMGSEGAPEAVAALARHVGRIVYLSAEAVEHRDRSFWGDVEQVVEGSGVEWTFLRPTGFAANTLMWAPQIRETGVVRWPYGQAARSLIHEVDIAEVAVQVLCENGHARARYVLSGPEAITQIDQVEAIGEAIDRPLRFEELPRRQAEQELAGKLPESALDTWAAFVETPEPVTPTVAQLTGAEARPFARWALDHADDFR